MKKQKKSREAEKREIKRLFLWVVITALIAVLLGISVLFYFFVPRDKDVYILTVPRLVGLKELDLGSFNRVEIEREWIYSDDAERGTIVSQTPYSGAKRKLRDGDSCPIVVYISLGEKTEEIPDLVGVDQLSAAAALRSIGATVKSVAIYGDGADGVVLRTLPESGSRIRDGESVTLFVSRKRINMPVSVPDFIGMERQDAVRLALSLGLFIGDIEENGMSERISAQSVPCGSRVVVGSYISFKTGEESVTECPWPPVYTDYRKEDY